MKPKTIIKNWQQHSLDLPNDLVRAHFPDCKLDQPLVFTGTVISDESGRYEPGWKCRSSLAINYDRENGIVETRNSIYILKGHAGGPLPDLRTDVLKITYE